MRMYPPQLDVVSQEPQAEDFCVIDVDANCGQGVLSLRSFRRGETLFRMNGNLTSTLGLHTLQVAPGLHVDDPYVAGKVLHSCSPNTRLDVESRLFIAQRAIFVGDLLTMDYEETEDVLFRSFLCCCGESHCRGEIVGRQVSRNSSAEQLGVWRSSESPEELPLGNGFAAQNPVDVLDGSALETSPGEA